MKSLTIEAQWQKYLELAGIKESQLIQIQRQEMKRSFFGACGQLIVLLRDDVAELNEQKGIMVLERMLSEVQSFWIKESDKQN